MTVDRQRPSAREGRRLVAANDLKPRHTRLEPRAPAPPRRGVRRGMLYLTAYGAMAEVGVGGMRAGDVAVLNTSSRSVGHPRRRARPR